MGMEIEFKLPVFSGPLDLLLHLIEKNKVSIYDIPIAEITEQYMNVIEEMKRRDLDIMSEFLVMASTLLSIKARMLLPKEETVTGEEEDPREELVRKLIEYRIVKNVSEKLRQMNEEAGCVCFRKPSIPEEILSYEEPVDVRELVKGLSLAKLNEIFEEVLKRADKRVDPVRSSFGKIKKEEVTVDEKIAYVSAYLLKHRSFSFRELLMEQSTKTEIIVTFLAVLELIKSGEIFTKQESIFSDIMIESRLSAA